MVTIVETNEEHVTTLLLARHATTASTGRRLGGRTEAPLDEAGRAQAATLAERLGDLPVKAVYASPLPRTWQTAEAVAAAHGLTVGPAEGLLEVDYGRWTNRSLKQVSKTKRWPVVQALPSLVGFPDGETIRGMQARAVEQVEALVSRHRRDVVVAVTHADVVKALVAFYLGLPLDLFQRLVIVPASVSVLRLGVDSQPVLLRLNDDGPLGDEHVRVASAPE